MGRLPSSDSISAHRIFHLGSRLLWTSRQREIFPSFPLTYHPNNPYHHILALPCLASVFHCPPKVYAVRGLTALLELGSLVEESWDTLHAWFELLVKLVASCPPRQNMLHIWGEEFPITAPKCSAFLRSHGMVPYCIGSSRKGGS